MTTTRTLPRTVDRVLAVARDEVGYREGRTSDGGRPNNNTKYAPAVPSLEWAQWQPWCATFVAWVALKAGCPELYPRTASCDVAGQWFKSKGRWSEYPAVGAQVFLGTPADLNHTGIVVSFTADTITTIEGNTNADGSREGDGVYRKIRRRADVVGYGYPEFPEGIESADPTVPKPQRPRLEPAKPTRLQVLVAELRAIRRKTKSKKRRRKITAGVNELPRK